jgi:hypothetical protein
MEFRLFAKPDRPIQRTVIPGLGPGIHVEKLPKAKKNSVPVPTWMAGTSPAMTG